MTVMEGAKVMTDAQFEREKNYRAAVPIAKEMLKAEVISAEDFEQVKVFFIERFQPVFGGIC